MTEWELVEQALALADDLNATVIARDPRPTARVQFVAHIIAALGLARANNQSLSQIRSVVDEMYHEMNRTQVHERRKKRHLKPVSRAIRDELKGESDG